MYIIYIYTICKSYKHTMFFVYKHYSSQRCSKTREMPQNQKQVFGFAGRLELYFIS